VEDLTRVIVRLPPTFALGSGCCDTFRISRNCRDWAAGWRLERSLRASASSVKIKSSVSSVLSLVSMECSRAARSWRGFARSCCWWRAPCISGSVNWVNMPWLTTHMATIRFHSSLLEHAMRDPYLWMAISNPKRTAASSWLSTVTTRPRSMTETRPLRTYETSPVLRLIVQMRVAAIWLAMACCSCWAASRCCAKSAQSVPLSQSGGSPRISLVGPVRYPCAEILRKCLLPPLLNGLF